MKIIYTTETGLSIIHPTGELSIEAVLQKDVPIKYKHTARIIEDETIPSDKVYRNAWVLKDNKVVVDLKKAIDVKKQLLRYERTPLLQALDIEYLISKEQGLNTSTIISEKNRLRNITKLCDSAQSIEELNLISIESQYIEEKTLLQKIKLWLFGQENE